MATTNRITPGSFLFGTINGINQKVPIVPIARELSHRSMQLISFLPVNQESWAIAPVAFQFPKATHPLADLAGITQNEQGNENLTISLVQRSFDSLDPSIRKLFAEKNIEVVRENLSQLSHLLSLIDNTKDKAIVSSYFQSALTQDVRNLLAAHIYTLSNDPNKGGENWGIEHATDDLQCLSGAIYRLLQQNCLLPCKEKIQDFALAKLETLSLAEKNAIFASVYHIGGRPKTSDANWGEHHCLGDLKRLISALHCHAHIAGPLHSAHYLKNWEKSDGNVSSFYSIEGEELPRGEISYLNGMGAAYEKAKSDAQKIHNAHCQGFAMHCVYASTQGMWDLPSASIGQNLQLLPQGRLLIQRWTEFFARAEPNDKYLQICASRGGIDVTAALAVLPRELQQRIIVIAIGPGYLIEKESCYKAVNLIIPEDSVPQLAPNHHLVALKAEEICLLPQHSDGSNAHDPHGSSYKQVLSPLIGQYILSNDIDLGSI